MSAVISPDGLYRYRLDRDIVFPFGQQPGNLGTRAGTMAFIMVNPSTADAEKDDPTIRRCIGFARRERCDRLIVGNLFAYRATDVKELGRAYQRPPDVAGRGMGAAGIIGPDNDYHLRAIASSARLLILGWGPLAKQPEPLRYRWRQVIAILAAQRGGVGTISCLGVAKDGHPRHPLMLAADAPLQPWHPPGTPRDLDGCLSGTWGGVQAAPAAGEAPGYPNADPQARWPGWPDNHPANTGRPAWVDDQERLPHRPLCASYKEVPGFPAVPGKCDCGDERLQWVGLIRDGVTYGSGFDSHAALRASLGDVMPSTSQLHDREGFLTTAGRFVSREEAVGIAVRAGQISDMWNNAGRRLLSSDINWRATK